MLKHIPGVVMFSSRLQAPALAPSERPAHDVPLFPRPYPLVFRSGSGGGSTRFASRLPSSCNWADNESSAHKLDSNPKTIALRTADAFNVTMDVSVIMASPARESGGRSVIAT